MLVLVYFEYECLRILCVLKTVTCLKAIKFFAAFNTNRILIQRKQSQWFYFLVEPNNGNFHRKINIW